MTVRHRSRAELQTFTERYRYAKALGVNHIINPSCEIDELQRQYLWLSHAYDELLQEVYMLKRLKSVDE